jgi:hypothetical protein
MIRIAPYSALDDVERQEIANIPSPEGKKEYLVRVAKFKPENIKVLNGELGVLDAKDSTLWYPLDPKGFDKGDIADIVPKAKVMGAQILGGMAGIPFGGGVASFATGAAGAGAAGAGMEALNQKLALNKISERTGVNLPMDVGAIKTEGALGVAQEALPFVAKPAFKLAGKMFKGAGLGLARMVGGKPVVSDVARAKIISGATNLEHGTVENIIKYPEVEKSISSLSPEKKETFLPIARDSYEHAMGEGLDKAMNDVYVNAGIKDSLKINIGKAIKDIQNKMATFNSSEPEAATAKQVATDIFNKLQSKMDENFDISFGDLKAIKRELFEIGKGLVTENNASTASGRYLQSMGHDLIDAVGGSSTEAAAAAKKYVDLIGVKSDMRNLTRMRVVDTDTGEVIPAGTMLESKLARWYKDFKSDYFQKNINRIEGVLASMPESKPLSKFAMDLRKAWAAIDIATKREVKPVGIGRTPIIAQALKISGVGDPARAAKIIAEGARSGTITAEKTLGPAMEYPSTYGGRTVTKMRALAESGYPTAAIEQLPGVNTARQLFKHPVGKRISIQALIRQMRGQNGSPEQQ